MSLKQRGKRSPRNRAGLKAFWSYCRQAISEQRTTKTVSMGMWSSLHPQGCQRHLEVDPGLAQRDEADDDYAGQTQQ